MAQILFISESQIKNQTNIETNVDGKILNNVIKDVQELQLKPILGNTLYNALLNEVGEFIVSGTTIPAGHQELLNDYVRPFMLNASVSDFIIWNQYKISNKGVLKLGDDQATPVQPQELEYLRNYYQNRASQHKANLVEYLKMNNQIQPGETHDTNVTTASIGWYLERK
ncbi:MAG: hypothetical protein EOO97_00050 [Pedobacter sp.]|nr:MAG: hypothetical protein EOO97_00050 [Pedobacter sp.]